MRIRKTLVAVLLFASIPSLPSKADDSLVPPIHGRIFTELWVPSFDSTLSTFLQASTSAWLEADPTFNKETHGVVLFSGDVYGTSFSGLNNQFVGNLREGYLDYSSKGFQIRAGQQIIPWGKSDAVNPTDYLSAYNYTFFNQDNEVRRVGATSLLLGFTPHDGTSPATLNLVFTPIFPQTVLLIPPSQIPSTTTLSPPNSPGATVANTEVAAKMTVNGTGYDFSLSAFHGFCHTPVFYEISHTVQPSGAVTVSAGQEFQHISAAGGDFSVTSGNYIFRGEGAFTWTDDSPPTGLLFQPNHADGVVGIERPLGDRFRIQVQGVAKYFPNYPSSTLSTSTDPVENAIQNQLIQTNSLFSNYQDQFRYSVTGRLTYTSENEDFEAQIFDFYNFVGGDSFFRGQVSYRFTEACRITAGGDYYSGPLNRPLGALADFSSVWSEFKYTF